jgi:hypothetical protein
MISNNIDIFEMDYEAAISYFIGLENLDKILHTNGPTVEVDNNTSLASSIGISTSPIEKKARLEFLLNIQLATKQMKNENEI